MQTLVSLFLVLLLGLPALLLPSVLLDLLALAKAANFRALWLLAGLLVAILFFLIGRNGARARFLRVLLHEHAHLMMALLLGTSPNSLSANEGAGLFRYQLRGPLPAVRVFFITLAPYWISPLLFLPFLLFLTLDPGPGPVRGLLALLLGIALILPPGEIHPRQTDLKRYGLLPPILAALWLWAATVVVSLRIVHEGRLGATLEAYAAGWQRVQTWIPPLFAQ